MSNRLIAVGWILAATAALAITSSHRDRSPMHTLSPGIDYVQGEVLLTFDPVYAPSEGNYACSPPSSGSSEIDSVFETIQVSELAKVVTTFDACTTAAGQYLERMYVLRYDGEIDAQEVVDSLSSLPYFDYVGLNEILWIEPLGTVRLVPGDTTLFSDQWYFDNNDSGDNTDIDLPEAWAIESGGDADIVIGIFDEGTMIDTTGSDYGWQLHSDFNHFWNEAEDTGSPNVINGADLDSLDNDSDGVGDPPAPHVYEANIIGFNLLPGYDADTTSGAEYKKLYWHGLPLNYQLCYDRDPPLEQCVFPSWEFSYFTDHGVKVASIAAAKLDGWKEPEQNDSNQNPRRDIVGVAYNCRVYWGRFAKPLNTDEMISAVTHLASKVDVLNMSFGTIASGGDPVRIAFETAAREYNCVLVAATGNRGNNGVDYPAALEDVLGVGAIKRSPLELITKSGWSTAERLVDVVAPTDGPYPPVADFFTGCPGPNVCNVFERAGQINETGTSFAAPQASGLAALICSRFPGIDEADVRTRIKNSAQFYWEDTETNRRKYGSGKINAYRALTEWGPITENVTWDSSKPRDGTYYISGDLTIENGGILTINAGTLIKIAPDHEEKGIDASRVEIVVDSGGTLNITGTQGMPVVFESFTDSPPGLDDWIGIRFEAGSTGVLEHVVIKNAKVAVETWDDLTVQDSEIHGSQLYGIWARGGDFRMAHTTVKNKTGSPTVVAVKIDSTVTTAVIDTCHITDAWTGIQTKTQTALKGCSVGDCSTGLGAPWSASVTVDHCLIEFDQTGVSASGPLGLQGSRISWSGQGTGYVAVEAISANITESYLDAMFCAVAMDSGLLVADTLDTDGYGLVIDGPVACRQTRIVGGGSNFYGVYAADASDDVTLRETLVSGFDGGVYLGAGSAADIDSSCTFTNNDTGVEVYSTDEVTIRGSTFDENTTNGIYLNSAGAVVEGNTITNNPNGIFLYDSYGTIQESNVIEENGSGIKCDEGSAPVIHENKIASNTVGIVALNDGDPDVGSCCEEEECDMTGACAAEGRNNISDNSSHHIVNLSPSVTIAAECNYWGPRGPLPSKFSGAVDYNPYLGSNPLPDLVAGQPEGPGTEEPGGDIPPDPTEEIPVVYDISQNYPNPFNPTTTIRYQVPHPGGSVRVTIYDIRGAAVRLLVNEVKAPGHYTLTWDGENGNGVGVASGVYFVRMTAPGFVKTEKLIVLK